MIASSFDEWAQDILFAKDHLCRNILQSGRNHESANAFGAKAARQINATVPIRGSLAADDG
jgi:ribose/xylose/arabinose/galactoside ABC-type transport system permease subunit